MKKLCIICVLMLFGAMATAAVDPNLNPDISQLEVVYTDDFEAGGITNYDTSGTYTFESTNPVNGQYITIDPDSYVRTRTLGDSPGIQVIDPASEVWTEFWVKVEGDTYWYNSLPQPMSAYSQSVVNFGVIYSGADPGYFKILIKDQYASAGNFRNNYSVEQFELGQWHHLRIGIQIHDSDGNGKYSLYHDPNGTDTWVALDGKENVEYATNSNGVTTFGRVQWSVNGTATTYYMSVDDLEVYARPAPPEQCGDDGTIYYFMDFNRDCYVDLTDFAQFASWWMECTDPADPINCFGY